MLNENLHLLNFLIGVGFFVGKISKMVLDEFVNWFRMVKRGGR
ncbi:hypothetical protein BAOM_0588 [Peribacillus asahii]|uniref:Uncharacterized protein n=1 Tax=Peribacillus asahii TaxID=228899 RepID=A0A3Q9RJT6_9BACI|nr:hypothetical protein BAOM_0588 [Peribacillus asahii]